MQELLLAGVPLISLHSADIRRFGYNLTLVVFTGESRDNSATDMSKIYESDVGKDGFLARDFLAVLGRDDFLRTPFLIPSSE